MSPLSASCPALLCCHQNITYPGRPSQNLVKAVCDNYRALNLHVPEEQAVPHLPPWRIPSLDVTFTPITKDAPPILQKQAALETIASVSASIPEAHHIYVDGSVQAHGSSACAVYSTTMPHPAQEGWIGRRLPNSSASTFCELHGILDAVSLLVRRSLNGVVVCDSQSALHSLSSPTPSYGRVAQDILRHLALPHDASLAIAFVWTPSHIGLSGNETVDRLAKAACTLDWDGTHADPSLLCLRHTIYSAAHASTVHSRNAERANIVSKQHHDHFLQCRHE
ncbi:hypothetical protein E2C01_047092 [Portunus trituberculatus]|uniref:RNase H type-1 domain-containing protein n=1 Tax=Portunus trituberculatus TaxID=210409 RepID=A0A5B7G9I6_PORTR|nr:hypothetical protein [Portunus trituberculatus]